MTQLPDMANPKITYEFNVTDFERVWLTDDESFYEMIMGRPNAVPMLTPDLAKDVDSLNGAGTCLGQCAGFYLVGVLRDTSAPRSRQANQGE